MANSKKTTTKVVGASKRTSYNAPKGYKPKIVKPSKKNSKQYRDTLLND